MTKLKQAAPATPPPHRIAPGERVKPEPFGQALRHHKADLALSIIMSRLALAIQDIQQLESAKQLTSQNAAFLITALNQSIGQMRAYKSHFHPDDFPCLNPSLAASEDWNSCPQP